MIENNSNRLSGMEHVTLHVILAPLPILQRAIIPTLWSGGIEEGWLVTKVAQCVFCMWSDKWIILCVQHCHEDYSREHQEVIMSIWMNICTLYCKIRNLVQWTLVNPNRDNLSLHKSKWRLVCYIWVYCY